MEKTLYDAAVENNVSTLRQLLTEDPLILDKASLNCQDMNPLHVAAMLGNVEFVKEVVGVSPDMCLVADRFGRIPLHLAVIKGRFDVLEELMNAMPVAAREKTAGGGNVLHLCVKHNRLKAMRFVVETAKDIMKKKDIANRKDEDGMTILHLAVFYNRTETIKYLLDKKIVDVNAKNAIGNTALDLFQGDNNSEIALALVKAGAHGDSTLKEDSKWLSEKRDTLMIVASLVAAMAFQAAINPTGGVWQDDSDTHLAGESVMAYKPSHNNYLHFAQANTVAFASSLSVIMLTLTITMWITLASIAVTFGVSISMVTPNGIHVGYRGVVIWCSVMSLLLLGVLNSIRLINRWLKRRVGVDGLKILASDWQSACGRKSHGEQGSCQMC